MGLVVRLEEQHHADGRHDRDAGNDGEGQHTDGAILYTTRAEEFQNGFSNRASELAFSNAVESDRWAAHTQPRAPRYVLEDPVF